MPWSELATVLSATAGTALVAVLGLWLASIPLRDVSIIDMAFAALIWGLVLVAWRQADASGPVPTLIVALVSICPRNWTTQQ